MGPQFNDIITSLPATVPFVGPEAQERARGRPFKARLGANESVFGPSPRAIDAMASAAADIWKYCDPDNHDLRYAVAEFHGVTPENIVITEGIDGGLGLATRLVVSPGETVITSDGSYPTFNFHVAACGGRLIKVPYAGDHEDLAGLAAAAHATNARIVYVSNPNNPMGSWWPADRLSDFSAELPERTLLILDEAYCDTAPSEAVPKIDVANAQVLRFRTFSKAYGMAGARIGYAIGSADVIANFEKIRNHYGINRLAQIGALAALDDQAYLAQVVTKIAGSRAEITRIVSAQGLVALPAATNFVTVDCGRDGAFAKRVLDGLLARDIFVRMPGVAPLNRCIRIGAGTEADMRMFADALPEALADAGAEH